MLRHFGVQIETRNTEKMNNAAEHRRSLTKVAMMSTRLILLVLSCIFVHVIGQQQVTKPYLRSLPLRNEVARLVGVVITYASDGRTTFAEDVCCAPSAEIKEFEQEPVTIAISPLSMFGFEHAQMLLQHALTGVQIDFGEKCLCPHCFSMSNQNTKIDFYKALTGYKDVTNCRRLNITW